MNNGNDFLKKIQPSIEQGNTIRMKVTLFSEDGKNWIVMRQHYISTAEQGFFDGVYIVGARMTLQNNDMKEMNDERQEREEGQINK